MAGRALRLIFRILGWVATPLVLVIAATTGAVLGLLIAPALSTYPALAVTLVFGTVVAAAGLYGWVRLLRRSPRLRHTLDMTVEGVPESPIVEHLMHPDEPESEAK